MRVRLDIALFFAALVISACGKESAPADVPLLRAVPSDAIALAYYRSCDKCLSRMVDSTDTFNSIEFGSLASRPAVFSYNYGGSLIPMLALELGEPVPEDSLELQSLIRSLPPLGFNHSILEQDGSRIIAISRSRELLSAVIFHMDSGESILSSAGFSDIFCGPDAIYVRNSTSSPLVKSLFPGDTRRWRRILGYIKDACDWIALRDEQDGVYGVETFCSADAKYFVNVFKDLKGGVSLMPEPEGTKSFVDLPLADWHRYRAAFELYLDSDNALVPLKKQKLWAEEFGPVEVARYCWADSEVLMARGRRSPKDTTEIAPNDIRGYIPALFGGALKIKDDSHSVWASGWLVTGTAEDLKKYLNLKKPETLAQRGVLAKVKTGPEGTLCWTGQGLKFYVY